MMLLFEKREADWSSSIIQRCERSKSATKYIRDLIGQHLHDFTCARNVKARLDKFA